MEQRKKNGFLDFNLGFGICSVYAGAFADPFLEGRQ